MEKKKVGIIGATGRFRQTRHGRKNGCSSSGSGWCRRRSSSLPNQKRCCISVSTGSPRLTRRSSARPGRNTGSTIYIPYHADECAEGAEWACQWNDAGRGTHRDRSRTDNAEHIFCHRAKTYIHAQGSGSIGSGPFGGPDLTDAADRYPLFSAAASKHACGGAAESVRCPPDSRSFGRLEARSGRNADLGTCSAVHTGTPARQECCSCGKCSADRDKAA